MIVKELLAFALLIQLNIFKAVFSQISTSAPSCGGSFTDDNGTIESPGYPTLNEAGILCSYDIQVSSGKRINLTFIDVDLRTSNGLLLEFVVIFDGRDCLSKVIGLVTDTLTPTFLSSDNQMSALFIADGIYVSRGFRAQYLAVSKQNAMATDVPSRIDPPFTICGGDLVGRSGNISYEKYKRDGELCIWRITVSAGRWIHLEIKEFKIEAFQTWARVLDGGNCSAPELKIFTVLEEFKPVAFNSTSNTMTVVLMARSNLYPEKFEAYFTEEPQHSDSTVISVWGQNILITLVTTVLSFW